MAGRWLDYTCHARDNVSAHFAVSSLLCYDAGLGHRLIKADPDADCGQFHGCEEVGVLLVVSGCDGAIMLDPIEEPLDLVAEFVDARAEGGRIDAVIERANVGIGTAGGDFGAQGIAVVAPIARKAAIRPERGGNRLPLPRRILLRRPQQRHRTPRTGPRRHPRQGNQLLQRRHRHRQHPQDRLPGQHHQAELVHPVGGRQHLGSTAECPQGIIICAARAKHGQLLCFSGPSTEHPGIDG